MPTATTRLVLIGVLVLVAAFLFTIAFQLGSLNGDIRPDDSFLIFLERALAAESRHLKNSTHSATTAKTPQNAALTHYSAIQGASTTIPQLSTLAIRRAPPTKRQSGRDGPDDSHNGLREDPDDYMYHAWNTSYPHKCHGTAPRPDCVNPSAVEWFRRHVLMSVVSGREGAFRVEVSQCSWLSHFPHENVFVFSDYIAQEGMDRTPHTWVEGTLPKGVQQRDGDFFSEFIPNGYVRQVRAAGQGYSAGWIEAQFRFVQSLEHLIYVNDLQKEGRLHELRDKNSIKRAATEGLDYRWFLVIDDDTVLNINHLVTRLQQVASPTIPWYLSRKGWGGAGHFFNHLALSRLKPLLPQCLESFMLKSFRASDAMLLKCSALARLAEQKEQTMSHCPASHLGAKGMVSRTQVSFHGKKDFYPPVLLTSWRVYLYYVSSYCGDERAGVLAADWSACAFGSCKQSGCTKEKNTQKMIEWKGLTNNGLSAEVPLHLLK